MRYAALFVFLALLLCLAPVQAQTVEYTATADKAVWGVDITAPPGSSGNIKLYLEDGSQVDALWTYSGLMPTTMSVQIGGETSDYDYYLPFPTSIQMSIWNGDNSSFDREVKFGYGQARGIWNNVIVDSISRSPTIGYRITSSDTITVSNEIVDRSKAQAQLSDDGGDSIIAKILEEAYIVYAIASWVFFGMKFLFVDNITLIVVAYFLASMAYFMNTSRDIFAAFMRFFRAQERLVRFIVELAASAISIVGQIAAAVASGTAKSVVTIFGILSNLTRLIK